jgi:uncharacterized membrane protein
MADLQPIPENPGTALVRDQDKIMLVLSYFGIFSLIPMLTVKDSEYVRWHAKQGIALCGSAFVLMFAMFILAFIPVLGWLFDLAGVGAMFVMFAVSIYSIVKAMNGERWKIPLIGDIAQKF